MSAIDWEVHRFVTKPAVFVCRNGRNRFLWAMNVRKTLNPNVQGNSVSSYILHYNSCFNSATARHLFAQVWVCEWQGASGFLYDGADEFPALFDGGCCHGRYCRIYFLYHSC